MDRANPLIARELAQFAIDLRLAQLPEAVRHEASRSLVNVMGCMLGGAIHPITNAISGALLDHSGPAHASLVGRASKADVFTATLINTVSASVLTFDDTHAQALVHPSAPVASAVLALCEWRRLGGAQFMDAFTAGVEILCRLAKAIAVAPATGNLRWALTSIAAPAAVAVAAGKLIGLDADQMVCAIGIAVTQSSGLRIGSGTMCFAYAPGAAAQAGLRAAVLAKSGMQGPADSLEGRDGLFQCFSQSPHPSAAVEGLGRQFEILANTYKPYPCGAVVHPAIDAMLEIAALPGFDASAVEHVALFVHAKTFALGNRPQPNAAHEAQVSVQHWAAAALLGGKAGMAEIDDDYIRDSAVATMRARIDLRVDEALTPVGAKAMVKMADGRTLHSRITHCTSSAERPMSDAQISAKFLQLAQKDYGSEEAKTILELCWNFSNVASVASIGDLLAAAPAAQSAEAAR